MNDIKRALVIELLNLHPVIVWGLVILDTILCAGEIFTLGISFFLSILISILFGIFTFYVQTMACGDEFEAALFKSITCCLIMMTPSSILTILYIYLYLSKNQSEINEHFKKEKFTEDDSEKDDFKEE